MNITPLRGELEMLDHRRSRLQEILDLGLVSQELEGHLRQTLDELDRRIATLQPHSAEGSYSIFAPLRKNAA